ncbi:FadR/GntR family transcriptional regulator [Microbacterium sp.]|uniref:FadR/GntR family transcriptional regulator n=1 Tax=Microbacterium sp. TaxID=51671 RepID=UPI003F9AD278
MRLQVAAQGFPLADVVRTRLVLEDAVVASLASDRGRDTSDAHRILDAMDADGLAAAEFLALDAQLHLALAESSGNSVIAAMMAGLRTAIESYVLTGSEQIDNWDAMTARLRAEHRDIVTAIDAGDADAARRLVHSHITGYYTAAGLTTNTDRND